MTASRWEKVRMVFCDVDGVLTDGGLWYGPDHTVVRFHVRDGQGARDLIQAGIPVIWITGRGGPATRRRSEELGITALFEGIEDKLGVLTSCCTHYNIPAECCCYIGDDSADLPAMGVCGTSIAVADAHSSVLEAADVVLAAGGGAGALREVADAILRHRAPEI